MVAKFKLHSFSSAPPRLRVSAPPHLSSPALLLCRLTFLTIFTCRSFNVGMLTLLTILLTGCPKDPPDPDPRDTSIFLELKKTWTTSMTLKVRVADTSDHWNFSLSRDDSSVGSYAVTSPDTVIVDNGLDPDREYHYRAYWMDNGIVKDSSNELIAVTMDTTSNNFIWTIDTLGNYGSYLNDVAIIDENNIWVVGNIETDSGTFNAAHWDGNEWEFVLIDRVVDFDGVFALSEDEIWFSDGCFIYEYDGIVFSRKWECDWETFGPGQANKIWGSSPDDIYFIGNSGSIVHYDGAVFKRMESGTDVDLKDIYGIKDNDGQISILTCGYSRDYSQGTLLTFQNNNWSIIFDGTENIFGAQYGNLISSVWLDIKEQFYVSVFSSLFNLNASNLTFTKSITIPSVGIYKIRGNNPADIFIAGEYGNIWHYNGSTWYKYHDRADNNTFFFSIAVADNQVCAVGYLDINSYLSYAIVNRGVRLE